MIAARIGNDDIHTAKLPLDAVHRRQRVDEGANAIKDGDLDKFAQVIASSGVSSYTMLQNCYAEEDKVPPLNFHSMLSTAGSVVDLKSI